MLGSQSLRTNKTPPWPASREQGIAYAVKTLAAAAPKATIYVDGAHGGWLGWENNARKFAQTIAEMDIAPYVRGFATNVANCKSLWFLVASLPFLSLLSLLDVLLMMRRNADQPTGTTACPADISQDGDIVKYCSLAGRGTECCEDACGLASEWNSAVTEVNYVAILHHMMTTVIPGFDPKCEFVTIRIMVTR